MNRFEKELRKGNTSKKSIISELKKRKDYDTVKTFQEPVDLFFPLMWSIVLSSKKKK